MELSKAIEQLTHLQKQMQVYKHAQGVLYYDGDTAAPEKSYVGRGETLSELSRLSYQLFANDQVGELLAFLRENSDKLTPLQAREVDQLSRDYKQLSAIPMEEDAAFAALQNEATAIWKKAKHENDYSAFGGYIIRIAETLRKFAGYYQPGAEPYGVWLDQYERGLTREQLDNFFARLREAIVPLLRRTQTEGKPIDITFLQQKWPVEKQRQLSDYLMSLIGIDHSRCTIGETEHPFTTNFNKDDVRITTHYFEKDFVSSMYSVIHEGGHALYELNTDDSLWNTCLAEGTSMGIHESQSRLFENNIGRSREFINLIFPKLLELFPEQLASVTAEQLYRAVNRAEPSLIRTEADELTYCLHIMVRYEMEKQLIAGKLSADELPALWNQLMKEYLGVTVLDDAHGILQDTHWSGGMMGYFPSYAIGSAYSAQIMAAMEKQLDVKGLIASGNFAPILSWLTEKIWRYGKEKDPAWLIENATGEPFNPQYYLDYLTRKFSDVYGLS